MPQYRDLNSPPDKLLADAVAGLRAKVDQQRTGSHGVKELGASGDVLWGRPSGDVVSIRDIDGDLESAQGRIDDAEQALAETEQRLAAAEQEVTDARDDLTELETVTLPNAVEQLEQADQAAQQNLSELDGKLATAFPEGPFDVPSELAQTIYRQDVQYAVSDSETTPPNSGWSADSPTRQPGEFIWFRTVITYGDGTEAISGAALMTGNAGAPGEEGPQGPPGEDGTSVTINGQLDSEADLPATGEDGDGYLIDGYLYVWTGAEWENVGLIRGPQGVPGEPGADGQPTYTWVKYADTSTGQGMSDDPANKRYIGLAFNRAEQLESTDPTDYQWALFEGPEGAPGDKGDKGDTGVSVDSIQPFFYAAADGDPAPSQPSGMAPAGWESDEPLWAPNSKLYRAERIIYDNDVISWTPVVLVASYAGVDQAITDARDAQNAAVKAQEDARNLLSSAENLFPAGGFESGTILDIFDSPRGNEAQTRRIEVIEDDTAHKGSRYIRLASEDGNANDAVAEDFPVVRGGTYRVSVAARIPEGMTAPTNHAGVLLEWVYEDGTVETSSWRLYASYNVADHLTHDWQVFTADYEVPSGAELMAVRVRAAGNGLGPGVGMDLDTLRVRDVTEVLAAEKAAAEAQARADEAFTEAAGKPSMEDVQREISLSADRKNAIVRSTGEPDQPGEAEGDTWYQVVDLTEIGSEVGKWIWDGTEWVRSLINSDMIEYLTVLKITGNAAEFEDFFAQNFTANEGVIEHLWTDQIVGKVANFNSLTVSAGNIIPDAGFSDEQIRADRMAHPNTTASEGVTWSPPGSLPGVSNRVRFHYSPSVQRIMFGLSREIGGEFHVKGGQKYRFTVSSRTAGDPMTWRWSFDYTHRDGSVTTDNFGPSHSGGSADLLESEFTFPGDVVRVTPSIRVDGSDGNPGSEGSIMDIGAPSMSPMVGAVLIEDGAVTAPKITFTEELSGEVANFMSTESKKLIVTEEAILNHATLIGQTVVDDINVQGKLIGTDGVFTGTVDFENVNVTGEAIIEELTGKTISGASLSTLYEGSTRAILSNTARDGWPGLAFETGGMYKPASVAAYDGAHSDEDVWPNGTIVLNSGKETSGGSPTSAVAAQPEGARLVSRDGTGGPSTIVEAAHGAARMVSGTGSKIEVGASDQAWMTSDAGGHVVVLGDQNRTVLGHINAAGDGEYNLQANISGISLAATAGTAQIAVTENQVNVSGNMLANGYLYNPGRTTTSGTPNVYMNPTSGLFALNTSSRRYKQNIRDWEMTPEQVLKLRPRLWEPIDPDIEEERGQTFAGWIAEEVHDTGLEQLVTYSEDENGNTRPESVNYALFSGAQQIVLQDHEARISELESENQSLREQLDALTARLDAAGV